MNEQIHEQLSALMDGELERDRTRFLLRRVAVDNALPLRWARYHVVRHTLRHQPLASLPLRVAGQVMLRLESEPAMPMRAAHAWLRWGAGGAIAASVAVAALVLTRPAAEEPMAAVANDVSRSATQPVSRPVPAAMASARSGTGDFRPPLLAPNTPVETAPASFGTDLVEPMVPDAQVQSYLIRHYQATGTSGQPNFVPYVLLGTPSREAPSAVRPNR